MATTARSRTPEAPLDLTSLRKPLDFFFSNFLSLFFSVVILYVFLFTPWFFLETARYNGGHLVTQALFGESRVLANYAAMSLLFVPLAALMAGAMGIWGLVSPARSAHASILTMGAAVIGLIYFADFYLFTSGTYKDYAVNNLGTGFKVTLVCLIGLLLQSALAFGPDARRIYRNATAGSEALGGLGESMGRVTERVGSRMPSIPSGAVPYLFLAAPLALYFVWIIAPTLYTFYLSLTNWDGISSNIKYVGFRNYENLFDDRLFREALGNNVRWLAIFITVPTTMGLALAMIFNTEMRGGKWYKVSFYSPLVLSGPVIALVWLWLYHPESGLLNSILLQLGVVSRDNLPGWHSDRSMAIYCIIAAAAWRQVGYVMVLYLAGLKNIDPSLIDAGLVDGANRWQLFRHVVFPLLAPVTTIIVVISIIDSLRAFDLVQIMTRGNTGTQVLANLMFQKFKDYEAGYAAAVAVVLFSISLFFIGFYLWRNLKDELEY